MEQLRQKFGSLKYPSHFLLYCLSFLLYATAMTGIGPFIPYLADATEHKQTQYSYLFFCRSAGFFTGSLLLKQLQHRIRFHSILMWASVFVFISMVFFTYFINFILQGVIMFFLSTFISIINILVNVCVAETQRTGDVNFWMHILHGSYGIGGLISPIIIYGFKLNSYMVIGTLILALVPFYFKLQTPENTNKNYKQIISSKFNQYEGFREASPNKMVKKHYISKDSEYLLCFLFWTYIGIELGFANWISSYAVIQNVVPKQQSLRYNSMFWVSMTIFRFISSLLPLKAMRKLMIHESLLMAFVGSSVLMIFVGQVQIACMFSSVTYGMCFSAMYPLFLSMPSDYGLEISSTQMANIALWSALGEATLALSFGLFMEWMGPNTLFYVMFIMVMILIFMTQYLQELYQKDLKKGEGSQLKQMLREH